MMHHKTREAEGLFYHYCTIISTLFYTMSIPATLVTGTIAYLVLGVVLIGVIFAMRSVGKLNKDDAA